jgi:predicted aspartyl protease
MTPRRVLSIALVTFCSAATARADDPKPPQICNLPLLASLDLKTTTEGMILVPGTIDGHKGDFLVDTGGLAGVLGWATAKQLAHSPYVSAYSGVLIGGATLGAGVTVDRFELGPLAFDKVGFLVAPDRMMGGIRWAFFSRARSPISITRSIS